MTHESQKKVVESAIEDHERSMNFITFGLAEDKSLDKKSSRITGKTG